MFEEKVGLEHPGWGRSKHSYHCASPELHRGAVVGGLSPRLRLGFIGCCSTSSLLLVHIGQTSLLPSFRTAVDCLKLRAPGEVGAQSRDPESRRTDPGAASDLPHASSTLPLSLMKVAWCWKSQHNGSRQAMRCGVQMGGVLVGLFCVELAFRAYIVRP